MSRADRPISSSVATSDTDSSTTSDTTATPTSVNTTSVTTTSATSWTGTAWSCTVRLVVTRPEALAPAVADLRHMLDQVDAAASRFRPDSAVSRANATPGLPTPVPTLLVELVDAALRAAAETDGAVDPTLGAALCAVGYDRDIEQVRGRDAAPAQPVTGGHWPRIRLHRELGLLTVPTGARLDLGATAKAWTADQAARRIARTHRTGVLVELGGDLAVAGPRPDGWAVRVAEREGGDGQVVTLREGGLATSTTVVRSWSQGGLARHHILDPRTGLPVEGPWRTATVHAPGAYEANVASTAALVLGVDAVDWLTDRGLAARLISRDGSVTTTGPWPTPQGQHVAVPSARRPFVRHRIVHRARFSPGPTP